MDNDRAKKSLRELTEEYINDRDYNVGDTLILKEWYRGKYTGREIRRTVSYIYYGDGNYGLSDGYVVMAIRGARAVLD